MALKDLTARQFLLILGTIVITGCFIRGVMSVWEGKLGLAVVLFAVCLVLSVFYKEKIAILYGGMIFLAVGFSQSAPFDKTGFSLLASIVLWAVTIVLLIWDDKRRMSRPR